MSSFLIAAAILNIIGGLFLMFADFAEGEWYGSYVSGYVVISSWETWGAALVLIPLGICMMMAAAVAGQGMTHTETLTIRKLNAAFAVDLIVFIIVVIGATAFTIVATSEDYDDWWMAEGFFGGFFGSLIGAIMLRAAVNEAKKAGIRPA